MELHPHRHEYRIVIVSLFVALSLISLTLVLQYQRNGMVRAPGAVQTKLPTTNAFSSIQVNKRMTVVTQGARKSTLFSVVPTKTSVTKYAKGEHISLQIVGSSNGKKVMGYDVLLTGGENVYDIVSVKSLIPEFMVLKFAKSDHVTITGIFKPSAKEQMSFEKTPMVELVVIPKQMGTLSLRVSSEQGKETSKLIVVSNLDTLEKHLASDSDNLRLDIKQ